jgi:uncharacterized protein YndB with AHSA1/START domain
VDRIERDILIAAPPEVVWEVVTEPEHVSQWFSDAAFEARPGANGMIADYEIRIEDVEPLRRFSFRWDGSLLVEFTLTAEDGGTRLSLVESGFEERGGYKAEHEAGWTKFLGQLREYAEAR